MSDSSIDSKRKVEEKVEDAVSESPSVPGSVDPVFERNTIRRVDRRMLPFLGLLYSISLVDRSNLSVAYVAGMGLDLGLNIGDRYSIVACLFFVPYILLQLPSNLVLRPIGPKHFITFLVIAWGAVQLGMGWVSSWQTLLVCRILLGLFEAGFFPAMVFIITTWYKRHEVQKRLAFFYLFSIVIAGFSAILAYAFQLLNGRGGLRGWRWIFIIEGLLTIFFGVLAWFYLDDFPDKNRFLTPEQTTVVLDRVEKDRGDALPDKVTRSKVLHHLGDWTIWAYGLIYMACTMPAYAVSYFITILLSSMGYSKSESLILTAPPYVTAAISCFIFAYISDRTKKRAIFIAIQSLITLTGLMLVGYTKSSGVRYFGLFLTNAGCQGCIPAVLAYSANNVVGHSKRSVFTAMIVSFGGLGGIFATTAYRQKDSPRYLNGLWATAGTQLMLLLLLGLMSLHYSRRNKLAREGKVVLEGIPGFVYTL